MADGVYARGDGTWRIAYDAPRGPDGKRKQLFKTFRGTKKEALAERRRILREIDTKTYIEPTKLTVGEYLERWLSDYSKPKNSGKTHERYQEIVTRHLTPALGATPLDKLHPLQIQRYYSHALESGRLNGAGGLAALTVVHHHRILHKALGQAVRWRLLPHNPCAAVEPPRPKHREKGVLDDDQIALLLRTARQGDYYIPILLAVSTGMRRGEVCALRWQDIDLDAGKLTVSQSLEQTIGKVTFKAPKTARGRRVIDLPSWVVKELLRHKGEQAQRRLFVGPAYQDNGLIVARPDGSPMLPHGLTAAFRKLARGLGLSISLHDLRHTHASQLMREGVHIKVVSERLGHSKVGFTLDTYSHLLPTQQEDAARRIDAVLRRAMGE
jgi:integrase